jgi:hypothetical protein
MILKPVLIREARSGILAGALILLLAFLMGEAAFRLPWMDGLLAYEYDEELGFRLASTQQGCLFMGDLSFLSPSIGINEEGYRNRPPDGKSPEVLCLGSSEALGTGVEDTAVWTYRVEERLKSGFPALKVVNAAGPAYGPFHCQVILKRFLRRRTPALVVVRVSIGDRNFMPPTPEEMAGFRKGSEWKRRVRALSRFLPFLVNKAEAQVLAIKDVFRWKDSGQPYTGEAEQADMGTRMWGAQQRYWRAMAETCALRSVPLIFFVDDPLDTDAGKTLEELIRNNLSRPAVRVERLGSDWFDLDTGTPEHRRNEYRMRYTLVQDPHANRAKHERVAAFVSSLIIRSEIPGRLNGYSSLREIPTP